MDVNLGSVGHGDYESLRDVPSHSVEYGARQEAVACHMGAESRGVDDVGTEMVEVEIAPKYFQIGQTIFVCPEYERKCEFTAEYCPMFRYDIKERVWVGDNRLNPGGQASVKGRYCVGVVLATGGPPLRYRPDVHFIGEHPCDLWMDTDTRRLAMSTFSVLRPNRCTHR